MMKKKLESWDKQRLDHRIKQITMYLLIANNNCSHTKNTVLVQFEVTPHFML